MTKCLEYAIDTTGMSEDQIREKVARINAADEIALRIIARAAAASQSEPLTQDLWRGAIVAELVR